VLREEIRGEGHDVRGRGVWLVDAVRSAVAEVRVSAYGDRAARDRDEVFEDACGLRWCRERPWPERVRGEGRCDDTRAHVRGGVSPRLRGRACLAVDFAVRDRSS